ncbi:CHAT domain-containing protein [Mycena capillaripes]|nr:CHAT domain-containing protein [Mycena capillaripes]
MDNILDERDGLPPNNTRTWALELRNQLRSLPSLELLLNTGEQFWEDYKTSGDPVGIEAGIHAYQHAMNFTLPGDPVRAICLEHLGLALAERYHILRQLPDLESALEKYQEALKLFPIDFPGRARLVLRLASLFFKQYWRLKDAESLQSAVLYLEQSEALTPLDNLGKAIHLYRLGMVLQDHHNETGDLEYLVNAVDKFQQAVDLTPDDHPAKPAHLEKLGESFATKFMRLGNVSGLEAAMKRLQEAVDCAPANDPQKSWFQLNLARAFLMWFYRFGELQYLEDAIQKLRVALGSIRRDHTTRFDQCLVELGNALQNRFFRLGNVQDLNDAVMYLEGVTNKYSSVDHPARALPITGLAWSLKNRYRRFGDLKDLDAAINKFEEAVDLTPSAHPTRHTSLAYLGIALRNRFTRLEDPNDINAAAKNLQEAVDLTPGDHRYRFWFLENFAGALFERYLKFRNFRDLETATKNLKQAVELTSENHFERAHCLQTLAQSLGYRYEILGNLDDLVQCHTYYIASFQNTAYNPRERWEAAFRWAVISEKFQQTEYCLAAITEALKVLPDILWIGHPISVRQEALQAYRIAEATSAVTLACIKLQHYAKAVKFLEQGLATTFQQTLQLKSDVEKLQPEDAESFRRLSLQLFNGTSGGDPITTAHQRNDLLTKVRSQPGLNNFLLPKPYSELYYAARDGPVIILNSHKNSCDAIIILKRVPERDHAAYSYRPTYLPASEPVSLSLTVTLEELETQRKQLRHLLRSCNVRTRGESESSRLFGRPEQMSSKNPQEQFSELLNWLWTRIVGPVYEILASNKIRGGRLWWLPTGAFTALPLHACSETDDRFIHSYIATLGTLIDARNKKSNNTLARVGIVGVTHTNTSGANRLLGVKKEIESISSVIPDSQTQFLEGRQATVDRVKRQLEERSWLHLACHGKQDLAQPTKSYLMLYEGSLELETILRMPLSNSEVVFLAACQTAMGDNVLVNESFHLGGGFIAAGFRGAVGTLWSMSDADGPFVAKTFYLHLFRDSRQPQASDAAEALHVAVKELRAQNVSYERWVPFIHMGV